MDKSDHVSLDSFEVVSLADVLSNTKDKSEEVVDSDNKDCYICKNVCSKELVKECSFAVKLKAKKLLCVNCQECKLSQMKKLVNEIAAKLGFEVLSEDLKHLEEQESDNVHDKTSYSNFKFYPDRSVDLFGNENSQGKPTDDDIRNSISKISSICFRCCCYSKDSCSKCIEQNFTCEGSCLCCTSYRQNTERECTDDGIEVLYEETQKTKI